MSDSSDSISEDGLSDQSVEQTSAGVAVGGSNAGPDSDEEGTANRATYLGWLFILLLAVLFSILMFWAYSLDDNGGVGSDGDGATTVTALELVEGTPVEVLLTVSDDGSVTISGDVPDEGARRQLIDSAIRSYGTGRVVDELAIDSSTSLVDGTVSTTGMSPFGGTALADLVGWTEQLGLTTGDLAAGFSDEVLEPAVANAAIQTDFVTLTGAFPDPESVSVLQQAAIDIFGEANVDASGLEVDSSRSPQDSTINITGLLDAGDSRGTEFAALVAQNFPGAAVNSESLAVDTSPEALGRLEEKLRISIGETPILFGSGSEEIEDASQEILSQIAKAIKATPDVPVEVVGHTDSSGSDAVNQQLSEGRARAVLLRLVELGVDPSRLSSRGAGESEPIADNDTDEGKAANRRIAFEFLGAAG